MEDEGSHQTKRTTYDVSKLINYPGFNISTPSGIPDVSGCPLPSKQHAE